MLAMAAADLYRRFGAAVVAHGPSPSCSSAHGVYFTCRRTRLTAFRPLRPQFCSIYDRTSGGTNASGSCRPTRIPVLQRHPVQERHVWRLLGVRIGRGSSTTAAHLGEDPGHHRRRLHAQCGQQIQCHSQEDGTFKSDHITIGAGCTLGVGAFVHYGVTMGDGAVLAPDSFLMKGEEVPPDARWGGNPAKSEHGSAHQAAERHSMPTPSRTIGESWSPTRHRQARCQSEEPSHAIRWRRPVDNRTRTAIRTAASTVRPRMSQPAGGLDRLRQAHPSRSDPSVGPREQTPLPLQRWEQANGSLDRRPDDDRHRDSSRPMSNSSKPGQYRLPRRMDRDSA